MLLESGQSKPENGSSLLCHEAMCTLYLNGEAVAEQTQEEGISDALTLYTTWFGAMRNQGGGSPMTERHTG